MGCVSSKNGDKGAAAETVNNAPAEGADAATDKLSAEQRRRLSVAPQHVGDITQKFKDGAGLEEDEIDDHHASAIIEHASQSRKGFVPYNRNKVNQDRLVVKFNLQDDADMSMFGVMDGHGEFGHVVAHFVHSNLPMQLGNQKDLRSDPHGAILRAVAKTVAELAETTIKVAFSGTTCVFGVQIEQKLYVANIGDSRCVLCRSKGGGKYEAIALSEDQKPENPEEKKRILAHNGRVEPLPGPPGEDCGPPRVWLADVDVPGLAMSRSIGDEVSQTVGVISVPEIREHDLTGDDLFGIWASDGVWEFISNEQAVDIVYENQANLGAAANALVAESNRRWREEEEVVDDITCVIVRWNKEKGVMESAKASK